VATSHRFLEIFLADPCLANLGVARFHLEPEGSLQRIVLCLLQLFNLLLQLVRHRTPLWMGRSGGSAVRVMSEPSALHELGAGQYDGGVDHWCVRDR
jgi:hypothetical protein